MSLRLIIGAIALFQIAVAQDFTYSQGSYTDQTHIIGDDSLSEVLIFPYQPGNYRGELDQQFCEGNQLDYRDFRDTIRISTMRTLAEAMKVKHASFVWDNNTYSSSLDEFYGNVSIKKESFKKDEDEKKSKFKLKKSASEKTHTTTSLENGQIVTTYHEGQSYYSIAFKDKAWKEQWLMSNDQKVLLSINQIEVVYPKTISPYSNAENAVRYVVRIHYDAFNGEGARFSKGFVEREVQTSNYQINTLIEQGIQQVAQGIVDSLEIE